METVHFNTRNQLAIDGTPVYAQNYSLPKTKRWFTTRIDGHQLMPLERVPRGTALMLDRMFNERRLRSVPHGFGSWSFWTDTKAEGEE